MNNNNLLLFSILASAVLVPATLVAANADTDEDLYELSDYEQVLVKNNANLDNATNADINDYVDTIREFRNNLEPWQESYMDTIDELSKVSLAIEKAIAEGEIDAETAEKIQQEVLLAQLEDWGIASAEKIGEDPKHWMDKAVSFKEAYEAKESTKTSGSSDGTDIHRVHVNTSLKINTIMWMPCWEWYGIPINCPFIDHGWNIDTASVSGVAAPTSGHVTYGSDICNERDVDHATVTIDYEIERIMTNVFGDDIPIPDSDSSISLDGNDTTFNCYSASPRYSIAAGSTAEMTTEIIDISVSGESHNS